MKIFGNFSQCQATGRYISALSYFQMALFHLICIPGPHKIGNKAVSTITGARNFFDN